MLTWQDGGKESSIADLKLCPLSSEMRQDLRTLLNGIECVARAGAQKRNAWFLSRRQVSIKGLRQVLKNYLSS